MPRRTARRSVAPADLITTRGRRGGLLFLAAAVAILLIGCSAGPNQARTNGHTPTPHSTPIPTAVATPTPTPTPLPVATIEFVGASVTAGWYASSVSAAYPADVVTALQQGGENVQARILAIPGATVIDALGWDLAPAANIVVVQMGSNNFAESQPLSLFTTRYQSLITATRQASPKADLVCLGEWHQTGIYNSLGNTPSDFDGIISSECQAAGGTFEPLQQVYDIPSDHGPLGTRTAFGLADLLHPNDAGDQGIAQMVLQGLQQQPPLSSTF